jgi:hypothetical protein
VGIYLGPGYFESFLDTHGKFTTIADPIAVTNGGPVGSGGIPFSGGGTFASGINNKGQIVGYYIDSVGASNGFVDTDGRFTTIDDPLGSDTAVRGINDLGEIVGSYYDATRGTPACPNLISPCGRDGFLDVNGIFTTIDVPGYDYTALTGINDKGQIVGFYVDSANVEHGFLATPVPEPASLASLMSGLIGLLFACGRQAKHRCTATIA